ncbi:epidermal growth factor receptor kinase substrate 8-like protein 3 isoform X2 [Hyperolius riggenbachi]|uniref:epidermal growth factor receptor kinase substrate 8-like protein 3 isoform X2 n=1 Tax=Hyperolius riggenbachi TaxID=752182 RepID=UPI0035A314C4
MDDYLNAIDGVLEQHGELSISRNVSSRPSAKSIYEQRKQYAQSLSSVNSSFNHRVEHLLTCDLGNDLRRIEDCLKHLQLLHAEGKVWGQDLILQIQNGDLLLTDMESRDNLENIALQNVASCRPEMGQRNYNSLLILTVENQRKTSVMLFQCEEQPATIVHRNLDKALRQFKEHQNQKDSIRNKLQSIMIQNDIPERSPSPLTSVGRESPVLSRMSRETPQDSPVSQRRFEPGTVTFQPPPDNNSKAEIARDIEVLNHVLSDIEKFVGNLDSSKKKKKGKAISESDFLDCLQKIKYAFNLLAKVQEHMSKPSATDLVHMLLNILPKILAKCPRKDMPSSVLSPFLTQKALLLMSACVTDKERKLWESLGEAWLRTRADWPNAKTVPAYVPVFSDGWVPPDIATVNGQPQVQQNLQNSHDQRSDRPSSSAPEFQDRWIPPERTPPNGQTPVQQSVQTPPLQRHFQPEHMTVLSDFEARNERELSVRKGDRVTVLDQSRQWWMVENAQQQRGFVPNNILESTDNKQVFQRPSSSLQPNSSPQEVTSWLQNRGFSRITVKCLGVLNGFQLLELSREDLKSVCPEEGGRVFTQLNEVRSSLGM